MSPLPKKKSHSGLSFNIGNLWRYKTQSTTHGNTYVVIESQNKEHFDDPKIFFEPLQNQLFPLTLSRT